MKDRENPKKYIPILNGYPGGNWFDSETNLLYVVVKGDDPVDILTTPVIQVVMQSLQKQKQDIHGI